MKKEGLLDFYSLLFPFNTFVKMMFKNQGDYYTIHR